MSQNILLLSEIKLKERANIDANVDGKLLINTIKWCQDSTVEPVCGTTLYQKLLTDVSGNTLAGYYKTLVDVYLIDMLLWFVMAEMPMILSYKFANKGVVKKTSETAETASMSDLVDIIPFYKKKAEYYEQRAIQYLKQNYALFPEYTNWSSGLDVIRPKKSGYTSTIPLDIRRPSDMTIPELYQGNGTGWDFDIDTLDGGTP